MLTALMTSRDFADSPEADSASQSAEADRPQERLRFMGISFKRAPAGLGVCEVSLERRDGKRFIGAAEGVSSTYADLRLAAEATLRAIGSFAQGRISLELIGVKALRAFDANIVIVSVISRHDGKEQRLLGCHLADEDSMRSAALATLQATNRRLGLSIFDAG